MNEIGDIRPSQLIFTFGVGALLDLPSMSAMVMGLDDWDTRFCSKISEDRLLAALQRRLGPQVAQLYMPPMMPEGMKQDQGAPAIGVPAVPFPRWLRCPLCDTLATVDSGVFALQQDRWRPEMTSYAHQNCLKAKGRSPSALAARFLLACREGHITDFPWLEFIHGQAKPCLPARMTLREFGASGDASDIIAKCLECGKEQRMAKAFDPDAPFACRAHHPHLRWVDPQGCKASAKTVLLGASNSWFPVALSAISVPQATDKLGQLVEAHWSKLSDIPSLEVLKYAADPKRMPHFADYQIEEIWRAIEAWRERQAQGSGEKAEDLKQPEWAAFSAGETGREGKDFKLRAVPPPQGFESLFEPTVLVERLREVRALMGFTRIESNGDFTDAVLTTDQRRAPLSRGNPNWLPVSEVRGEGLFLRLREETLGQWEALPAIQSLGGAFLKSHSVWRRLRNLTPEADGFPAMRYVLLHSLAHALMRQIVLDCGYTAASVRERLYSRVPGEEGGPMAGFLLYTAASDSEGTLGGLVDLGTPASLGRHLTQTLENLRMCASDPLCSEHEPATDGRGIHAASCHACMFAPETSCERGNRYLDRGVLVKTFKPGGTAFFEP